MMPEAQYSVNSNKSTEQNSNKFRLFSNSDLQDGKKDKIHNERENNYNK